MIGARDGTRDGGTEIRRAGAFAPALTCTFFGGGGSQPSCTFGPQTRHYCRSRDLPYAAAWALHYSILVPSARSPEKLDRSPFDGAPSPNSVRGALKALPAARVGRPRLVLPSTNRRG